MQLPDVLGLARLFFLNEPFSGCLGCLSSGRKGYRQLAFCAAPRAQHLLRNVPPADMLPYARSHDDAVWAVVEGLLACSATEGPARETTARLLAKSLCLPRGLRGLGLLAVERAPPPSVRSAR